MKKLLILLLCLISLKSVSQTWYGTGTANLQRTPTAKGWFYRNNMGAIGNVPWYTAPQLDSLLAIAIGSGVTSFNTRVGAVVPLSGDYSAFYAPVVSGGYVPYTGATSNLDLGNNSIFSNYIKTTGNVITATSPTGSELVFGGLNSANYFAFKGSNTFIAAFYSGALTNNRNYILPDAGTTLTGIDNVATFTNKSISGGTNTLSNIGNTSLTNSSITINGNSVSLGGSTTVTAATPNSVTFNNSGSGAASGTTFDGSVARTISYNTIGAQPTGNYITALTGEATATGPGSSAVTLTNSAVIGKVLTGYTSGAGTVSATDNILQAIQKLNGNIGALTTGVSSFNLRTGAVIPVAGDYASLTETLTNKTLYTGTKITSVATYQTPAGTVGTDSLAVKIGSSGKMGAIAGNSYATLLQIPFVTPEQYGAVGNGITNDNAAFTSAVASGKNIFLTSGKTYLITASISLGAGQSMFANRDATIKFAGIKAIIAATGSTISGVKFSGNKSGASSLTEYAVYINNVNKVNIENNVADNIATAAFYWEAVSYASGSNRIAFNNVSNSTVGYKSGLQGEYSELVSNHAIGCDTAVRIIGGNNPLLGGEFNSNAIGVYLGSDGVNPAHSQFVGVTANHNTSYNLVVDGVSGVFGQMISGSNFESGNILIKNSSFITFNGSTISLNGGTLTNDNSSLYIFNTNLRDGTALVYSEINGGTHKFRNNIMMWGGTSADYAFWGAAGVLASSDFANQGSSATTVLHPNPSGNPTWSQIVNADIANTTIDLTAKVTGLLPNANLANPSLTIGSTNIALGATATTIAGLTSVTSTIFVGNASTSTKWAATKTFWGQAADGSANVSGAMSGITSLAMTGALSGATNGTFSATVTAGTLTASGTNAHTINNTSSTGDTNILNILATNLPTGSSSYVVVGGAGGTNESMTMQFNRIGAASTSNYMSFALFGAGSASLNIYNGYVTLPTTPTTSTVGGYDLLSRNTTTGAVEKVFTSAFMTNPMTTTGDIIYGGSSGTPTRLGIGSGILIGGSTPSWATALPNGTTATTQSANDNSTKVATTAYADAIKAIHGNSTTTGTATTAVTVTIGSTMANTTYNTTITPRDALTAVNYYVSAQTTTTFTVTFLTALTGSINFDYNITP